MNSLLSYPDLYSSCSGPALYIPVLNFPSPDVNATTSQAVPGPSGSTFAVGRLPA